MPGVKMGMFEQSVLQQQHSKPWTFGVSMTLQAAMIGSAVLLSILHVQTMDIAVLKNPLMAPPIPRIPDFVELVPTPHRDGGIGFVRPRLNVLYVPQRIPKGIAQVEDLDSSAPDVGMTIAGSRDGVPYGNVLTPMATAAVVLPQPPDPQPRPSAEPVPQKPIRVSLGVMEAKLIKRVMPVYPPVARQMRIEGTVSLVGTIGRDGTIQNLQVMSGHPLLAPSAVDAVKQWVYRPTLLNGEPVEVIAPINVNFTLSR